MRQMHSTDIPRTPFGTQLGTPIDVCLLIGHMRCIQTALGVCAALSVWTATADSRLSTPNSSHDHLKRLAFGSIQDIYVINLDRRPDRLASVDQQLKSLSLPYTRFPAIDGGNLRKLSENKTIRKDDIGWHPRVAFELDDLHHRMKEENDNEWGRFGCWQSHLQVYLTIVDRARTTGRDGPVLILEDDVLLDADLPFLVKQAMDTLPDDWEFFAIGHFWSACTKIVSRFACRANRVIGGQGYIIRNAAAAEILIGLSNTRNFQIADLLWLGAMEDGRLKAYIILPTSIVQQDRDSFGSDIAASSDVPAPNLRLVAGRDHGEVVPLAGDETPLGHFPMISEDVEIQSSSSKGYGRISLALVSFGLLILV